MSSQPRYIIPERIKMISEPIPIGYEPQNRGYKTYIEY